MFLCRAEDSVGIYPVFGSREALERPLQVLYSSKAGDPIPPIQASMLPAAFVLWPNHIRSYVRHE